MLTLRQWTMTAGLLVLGLSFSMQGQADTATNGTFRFLTQSLPDGSTNAEYVARLLTANADGPVTYSASALAPGMSIDANTGRITGRPTDTFNQNITITADDGSTVIQQNNVKLKVSAAGGGGNAGSTFANESLADGEVGEAYSQTLSIENGVGPFVFGAAKLPPGLSLNGLTGAITGTPLEAGTFFANLSVVDFGENNNKVLTV
ncbi:MAG: putative Ig domain-containing protein, partial [Planctomycetota bacterium]